MHRSVLLPAPARLREWQPEFPPGDLRAIVLHWTAHDYDRVFPSYHFCLTGADDVTVVATHDLRANMRDVRVAPDLPYAAHVAGRNSWTIGVAACAMRDARPDIFGTYPLGAAQVGALCVVAARLARAYGIRLVDIRTHAEVAARDGYFGDGADERWDLARLEPRATRLDPAEAAAVGDELRARIAAAG